MPGRAQTRWNSADGSTEILYPDGSYERWKSGEIIDSKPADAARARAFSAGDYDAVSESVRYGTEWLNSPMGQMYLDERQRSANRLRETEDRDYELRRGDYDLRGQQADRQYGLDRERLGLERERLDLSRSELDRRFDLEGKRVGIDFFRTATEYGRTPRRWTDAIQFESPTFMSNFAQGLANPAFGAKGSTPPQMNSITDSVAASVGAGGGGGSGVLGTAQGTPLVDPAKNIQAILKGAPPSEGSGFTDQDIAAVRLIGEMYKNGGKNVKEGVWESYDPDEREYALGVMDQISPNGGARFERDIARSRIPRSFNPYGAG